MSVEIINFGARIKSIKFPINSKPTQMILGYESAKEYLNDEFYLGATVAGYVIVFRVVNFNSTISNINCP